MVIVILQHKSISKLKWMFHLIIYWLTETRVTTFLMVSMFSWCFRVPPSAASDPSVQNANYVPMTPAPASLPTHPTPASGDQASLGRQVPPPAHMGFRTSPLTPAAPLTPPVRRNTMVEVEATPPPIHRNLKPQRKGGHLSLWRVQMQLCPTSNTVKLQNKIITNLINDKVK